MSSKHGKQVSPRGQRVRANGGIWHTVLLACHSKAGSVLRRAPPRAGMQALLLELEADLQHSVVADDERQCRHKQVTMSRLQCMEGEPPRSVMPASERAVKHAYLSASSCTPMKVPAHITAPPTTTQ